MKKTSNCKCSIPYQDEVFYLCRYTQDEEPELSKKFIPNKMMINGAGNRQIISQINQPLSK